MPRHITPMIMFRNANSRARAIAVAALLTGGCAHHVPAHSEGPVTTIPSSQLVFTDNVGLTMLTHDAPRYPDKLQSRGISQGTVALFVVDTAGRVPSSSIRFTRQADRAVYDAVCDALSRARFAPVQEDGEPRPAVIVLPYTFDTWSDTVAGRAAAGSADSLRQSIRQDGLAAVLAAIATRPGC